MAVPRLAKYRLILFDNASALRLRSSVQTQPDTANSRKPMKAIAKPLPRHCNLLLALTTLTLTGLVFLTSAPKAEAEFASQTGYNTQAGWRALDAAGAIGMTGIWNSALGFQALCVDASGSYNNAVGGRALFHNTHGNYNNAVGSQALYYNSDGNSNNAFGYRALFNNTNGAFNTAIGNVAMASNTEGHANTATGNGAMYYNTTAQGNTANGYGALNRTTTGSYNIGVGFNALLYNTIGDENIAIGYEALKHSHGNSNIGIGSHAGGYITTGYGNIDIGNYGTTSDDATIRIGQYQERTFIAGIYGVTVPGASVPVVINNQGQLGVVSSSQKFKKNIKPMGEASSPVLGLKPVTFQYKDEIDPTGTKQFGLIAEEVEKIDPNLVIHDKTGKPYTVRYDAVNALLLNEFLKEHAKVETLQSTVSKLETQIATLTSQVQKVSAQVEVNADTPKLVSRKHK